MSVKIEKEGGEALKNANPKAEITTNPKKAVVDPKKGSDPKVDDKKVPLKEFLDVKAKNKAIKVELEKYKEDEKKRGEAKLLEEKKYEELIASKDKEIAEQKVKNENYAKNIKVEKIKNKISAMASKNGAVDAEDVLKFISTEGLEELESTQLEEQVKIRIDALKANKEYLFSGNPQRNKAENGSPYKPNIANGDPNRPKSQREKAIDMLKAQRGK